MVMRFPGGLGKALTLSYDDGVEQDRQLMALLASGGGERLRQAADAAKRGDHARAMELLRPVLSTEQAQALLRKLNG